MMANTNQVQGVGRTQPKAPRMADQGGITGAFQKVGEKIPGTTAWNDAHGKYDSPTHDLGPVGQTRQGAEGGDPAGFGDDGYGGNMTANPAFTGASTNPANVVEGRKCTTWPEHRHHHHRLGPGRQGPGGGSGCAQNCPVVVGGPALAQESGRPATRVEDSSGSLQDPNANERGLNPTGAPNESGIGGRPMMGDRFGDCQPGQGGEATTNNRMRETALAHEDRTPAQQISGLFGRK